MDIKEIDKFYATKLTEITHKLKNEAFKKEYCITTLFENIHIEADAILIEALKELGLDVLVSLYEKLEQDFNYA
jgi:hypothetical protein